MARSAPLPAQPSATRCARRPTRSSPEPATRAPCSPTCWARLRCARSPSLRPVQHRRRDHSSVRRVHGPGTEVHSARSDRSADGGHARVRSAQVGGAQATARRRAGEPLQRLLRRLQDVHARGRGRSPVRAVQARSHRSHPAHAFRHGRRQAGGGRAATARQASGCAVCRHLGQ